MQPATNSIRARTYLMRRELDRIHRILLDQMSEDRDQSSEGYQIGVNLRNLWTPLQSNLRGLSRAAVSFSDVSQRIGQGPNSRSQQHNILDQELARRRGEGRKSIPCLPYSWRRNDKTQRS